MKTINHKFVEFIPDELEDNVLYITVTYRTAVHKCVCGCNNKVITPLSPTDWRLIFDGKTVSLHPSIGNWGFDCRSHYWITKNCIHHASDWSQERVEAGRTSEKKSKKKYFKKPRRCKEAK